MTHQVIVCNNLIIVEDQIRSLKHIFIDKLERCDENKKKYLFLELMLEKECRHLHITRKHYFMSIKGCKIHQLTRGTNLLGIKSPSITPQNFAILGGMKMASCVLST